MFPAPAGLNPDLRDFYDRVLRVPRARGAEPDWVTQPTMARMVFPAPAGLNRTARRDNAGAVCVPRARGAEPYDIAGNSTLY